MPLKPVRDLVYILPLKTPEKKGSLFTSPSHEARPTQGIIKYRGPATIDIKVGDHVFFSGYDGKTMVIEGEGELLVMEEEYILAIDGGREEKDWLFTLNDMKRAIEKAGAIAASLAENSEEQEIVKKVVDRMISQLDGDFCERLFF